jgi:hypothetical protein
LLARAHDTWAGRGCSPRAHRSTRRMVSPGKLVPLCGAVLSRARTQRSKEREYARRADWHAGPRLKKNEATARASVSACKRAWCMRVPAVHTASVRSEHRMCQ